MYTYVSEITKCIASIKDGKNYYSSNFYKILNSNTSDRMEYPEVFESFSLKKNGIQFYVTKYKTRTNCLYFRHK